MALARDLRDIRACFTLHAQTHCGSAIVGIISSIQIHVDPIIEYDRSYWTSSSLEAHSKDLCVPEADKNLELNYYQQLAEYYQLYERNNARGK